ncbi:hypothetical protein PHMEG_00011021 [Phytophthora megakarya]|uniref:Uncharacterized protein n=1 Tax=Phytophthora megakarya TaxID=4795 RepID=A0A225WC80_9STRA|nr:hypothetical protein PHMEG_00011021 [Phytophthora megakarya]
MNNLPVIFCENRDTRRYSTLDPICVETLCAAMGGVVVAVERSIASDMPDIFRLILDGWCRVGHDRILMFG